MDALPITEASEVSYKSRTPGVMHACGHDGHITIALGVARWLQENRWPQTGSGEVVFIFQPAEEGGAGALAMLEAGLAKRERIAAIFAGHLHPDLPAGEIGLAPEVSNAASDQIRIQVTGKGGHGAHPHQCVDPIVAASHLVTQLQTVVSRAVSPLESVVVTIGRFHAGTAPNIIPHRADLEGTLRTLREDTRQTATEKIHQLVAGLEKAFGVAAQCEIIPGYPLLVNNPEMVRYIVGTAGNLLGSQRVHLQEPRMGSEDFAYFLRRFPGALIRLGCGNTARGLVHGLHSPFFDFDEAVLDVGVVLFGHLLRDFAMAASEK
jgi:amidohydrolase